MTQRKKDLKFQWLPVQLEDFHFSESPHNPGTIKDCVSSAYNQQHMVCIELTFLMFPNMYCNMAILK